MTGCNASVAPAWSAEGRSIFPHKKRTQSGLVSVFLVRNVHCPSGQRDDGQQTGGSTEKYSDPGTEE